jgi:hypothetical protein
MDVCHFSKVDIENITGYFSDDGLHRAYLNIPLTNRAGNRVLCIIGQNPSKANAHVADKTLHYLERYVYENMPEYSRIIMLNLYSRLDTYKTCEIDIIRFDCERLFRRTIGENSDFLLIFGKLKKQGAYDFIKKAELLKKHLINKNVYKINIGSDYAPHPGNQKIYYGNYCHGISRHEI